jgi:hypothetical protein
MKQRKICIVGDVAMIPLTRGEYAFVDAEDAKLVDGRNWHLVATKGKQYAATVTPTPTNRLAKTYMHRMVAYAAKGLEVDHINNNGLDNRRDNLRVLTQTKNKQNRSRQKNNVSGHSGVFWSDHHGKWVAEVQSLGKKLFIGAFNDVESASHAVAIKKAEIYEYEDLR